MIITDSASLWCFAARRSAKAMATPLPSAAPIVGALGDAAAEHHRDALRVCLSPPPDCVAILATGGAIACEARLAVNVDKLTELAIIMLNEHWWK
jgi:hypothetical protein